MPPTFRSILSLQGRVLLQLEIQDRSMFGSPLTGNAMSLAYGERQIAGEGPIKHLLFSKDAYMTA